MTLHLPQHQRGLSLATAIFVITVMALLAAMIFQLVRSNAETTQEEILLNRAFNAAESGIQFGLNQVFPPDGSAGACPLVPDPRTYTFTDGALNACTAEVQCGLVAVDLTDYYTITSKGTCDGVSRTIQVRAQ